MKNVPRNPSYLYLKIFIIILVFLTIGTTLIRLFQLLNHKTFTPEFYSVAIIGETNTAVHSFIKDQNGERLSILHVLNTKQSLSKYSLLEKSIMLGIPLSASMEVEGDQDDVFTFSNTLAHVFGKKERLSQRIGDIDYLFMYLKTKKVSNDSISEKKVAFDAIRTGSVDPGELSDLFRSEMITNEKISISVINASSKPGIAKKVADMLEIVGYYVISIDSADVRDGTTVEQVSSNKDFVFSYLFGFPKPVITDTAKIEDVKIIVGRDSVKNL